MALLSRTVQGLGCTLPLALLLACAGGGSPQASLSSSSPSQAVSLSPDVNRITMTEQHNRQFTAVVNGTDNQAVTWKVLESDGGSIDAVGNYTAPNKEGTFHIQVTSAANPAVSSTIETTVVPPATIGTFVPSKGYTTSGGAVTLTASWSGGTASIDHGVGALATSPATPTVNPTASTVYNLTVINSAGDPTIQSVFVKVDGTISVYVTPTAVRLGIRQSYAFVAVVTGATDNRVTWSVEEGASGGTINYAGAYTAPANAAGTFHVRATSVEDPTKYSRSTVTVTYAWSTPLILDGGIGSNADCFSLSGDPVSGNAFAMWMETDPTSGNVVPWAAKYSATTGTWAGFRAISDGFADGTGGTGNTPCISMDGSGNAMAVWIQTTAANPSRYDLFAAYYKAGSGWQPRVQISNGANIVFDEPRVVLDSTGALAVWTQTDGTNYHVWSARFTGGTWGAATQIETNASGGAYPPYLSGDGSGHYLATWAQSNGTAISAYSNYYASTSWGGATEVTSGALATTPVDAYAYSMTVRSAMDASGTIMAVWSQKNVSGYYVIYSSIYTPGSGWAAKTLVYADGAASSARPALALDGSGNAIAVWYTAYAIKTSRYSSATSWAAAVDATGGNQALMADAPGLALDAAGDAIVSWTDASDYTAWVNSSLAGGAWRTPTHAQAPSSVGGVYYGSLPTVFQDAQGRGLLLFPYKPGPQDVIGWSRLQ
ncbi:MAG TPA: hypothetical protein VJ600_02445 [Holophagaceae bacterium]|nr:hypothetical protein [Holophagaceae bacterium]